MNLVKNTFPDSIVNIKDESAGSRVTEVVLPLHRPFIPIRAAKGDGKVEWLNGRAAYAKYGEQSFDKYEKFWRGEQLLLTEYIFPNQGAYVMRIIPPDAKKATMVIEAHVTQNVQIQQFQRDSGGQFIYDATTGDPIPAKDAGNNPIYLEGVKVKYKLRKMTEEELEDGIASIKVVTITDGKSETKIYPIVAVVYKDPSAMGNKAGMKLYININRQTSDLIEATNSLLWTFVPMEQPYNSNVAYEIIDKFGAATSEMVMRPNQLDPFAQRRISAADSLLRLYYNETTKEYLLPYDVNFYDANIEAIGDVVRAYEAPYDSSLTNGWMVNIAEMTDLNGNPYRCAILDDTDVNRIQLSNLSVHYLTGGEDGDTSDEAFEEGLQKVLNLKVDPELSDRFHYLITHLYDPGYTLATKFTMADFMAVQGYCKIVMAAQDANRHLYNMDEAVSVAHAIRARCAITPESELYGTQAMRATIYSQAGYLNDTSVKNIIPMTFWAALRRSQFHNSPKIKGSWGAYPANVVDIYREVNFTPYSASQKQLLWDGAANYIQWCDGFQKFMPSCRSIYKDTTSLLSDDEFTDACIYMKYLADKVWTRHVSRRLPIAALCDLIQKDLVKEAYDAFGSQYTATATAYESDEDKLNHDTLSIEIGLEGDYPKRIWNTTIIARGRTTSSAS